MSERDGMLRQIGLGLDAEVFMDSDLGKDFLSHVADRAIDAIDKLKVVNPSDFRSLESFAQRVAELQNEVIRAETFEEWMVEVVETGRNTEENLLQQEAEEH